MYDIVVIGGGPAGVTAALRARELGASVALVERQRLGGTCTNDGCIPTRVLAKAARLLRDYEQYAEYGIATQPPQLNFSGLMQQTQAIVEKIHEKKQLADLLKESGVDLFDRAGVATFVDAHTLRLNGEAQIQAQKFIICAGGHARRLPFPGAEYCLTHSDVWALRTAPQSLTIVGGAATGCQLGSVFATFGSQVTILETSPRLLAVEDEVVSRTVQQAFQSRGIRIIPQIGGVDRVEKDEHGLTVYYKQGDRLETVQSGAVVLAVGWPGNADTLNLAAAGVNFERSYVQVDDYMRTSAEHIFAAGDITGRMMLVQSANSEALAAAENAVLGVGLPQKHSLVPHGGFTDPEYGSVGLTEARAREQFPVEVAVVPYADIDRAVIDDHTTGYCKLIVNSETHRIVGAHVVGEQALEIVQIVAAGMAADIWVEQLADMEISYPTYTGIVGLAARQIVNKLGVRPLSPQWHALRRPYAAEWEQSSSGSSL